MIQIDMPMPEKCSDCIFCNENCSCVASDYNGLGINVGCAYRAGRRDIRCPLKEQEAVKPKCKERIGGFVAGLCPTCGTALNNVLNVKACGKCGQKLMWE